MDYTLVSLLSLLLGGLIGHRLAVGRDRRKERNASAEPVREWLLAECERVGNQPFQPTEKQIDAFVLRLRPLKRRKFQKDLAFYRKEIRAQMSIENGGLIHIDETKEMAEARKRLLRITEPR